MDFSKIPGAKRSDAIPSIAPELATLTELVPLGDEWLHEIKFDGYRIRAEVRRGKVILKTRNDLNWTDRFPKLAQAIGELDVQDVLLDGEIVHLLQNGVTSFSGLQKDIAEGTTGNLHFFVFDLLHANGWDLTSAALERRKEALAKVLATGHDHRLQFSDHQIGRGRELFANACTMGLEGIVSKRRDSPYRSGRQAAWLKAKCVAAEELIVVGFTEPEGARVGFGALLLAYYTPQGQLVFAGKVGTGYSDRFLTEFRKKLDAIERSAPTVKLPTGYVSRGVHWVRPEIVAGVGFSEWTTDGTLRHPRFIDIRDDKTPAEIILDRGDGS